MKSNTPYFPTIQVFLNALALAVIAVAALAIALSAAPPSTTNAFAESIPAIRMVPAELPISQVGMLEIDEASTRACCDRTE
jgi:hypothetical protein